MRSIHTAVLVTVATALLGDSTHALVGVRQYGASGKVVLLTVHTFCTAAVAPTCHNQL
jgi:hypothetical protein